MGQADRQAARAAGEAAEARLSAPPVDWPTAPPLAVWEELAEITADYRTTWEAWEGLMLEDDPPRRAHLEARLLELLSHLQAHSAAMIDTIDDAALLADELEERELERAKPGPSAVVP